MENFLGYLEYLKEQKRVSCDFSMGGPVDPQRILVFEDAPSGVLAAKNAGMSVVMVPDARLDSSYHLVADQVLSSLLDFSPANWGLPPFENASTKLA
ncbi:glutathione synthase [Datura stramonium]|uniref:Glutathione synthase n=1 Tax=Datura stramonium TaxID=4076 RepID=A0ABS8V6U6_DATST|nr:glutathione synthase [Datura stramonium]